VSEARPSHRRGVQRHHVIAGAFLLAGLCGGSTTLLNYFSGGVPASQLIGAGLLTAVCFVCAPIPLLFPRASSRVILAASVGLFAGLVYLGLSAGMLFASACFFMIPVMVAMTAITGPWFGGASAAAAIATYTHVWLNHHQAQAITVAGSSYIDWTVAYLALSGMVVFLFVGTCLLRAQTQSGFRALQNAKHQSERSEQLKSTFLANMSHEIRTPINGVLGMLDVCLQSDDLSTERHRLTIARDAATSLVRLLDDILDHERLENGGIELVIEPINVRQAIQQTVGLFEIAAELKGLSLDVEGLEKLPRLVELDGVRFGQILKNLLSNAIKYTDHGVVKVSATYAQDSLSLTVADTGRGMPNDFLPKLFDRFSQVEQGLSDTAGGAGLGLSICHQLCTLMDGKISVDSSLGFGSQFHITVPARKVQLGITSTDEAKLPAAEPSRELSVLVVEDNQVNLQVVEAYLRNLGHKSVAAMNGKEAVELASAGDFDLLLMDVAMPVMDGIEATRIIRSMPASRGTVPILMLTAHVEESYLSACRSAGCSGILHKPLTVKTLQDAIANTLEPEGKAPKAEAV